MCEGFSILCRIIDVYKEEIFFLLNYGTVHIFPILYPYLESGELEYLIIKFWIDS
jgi:hypothetical protein